LVGASDIGGRFVSAILIGLFFICLIRPAGLDLQVGSWLFWLGLLIMPGYLVADMVTWQLDLDWIERLALAFPLGITAMAPVGETVILAHFNVQVLAVGWVLTAAVILAAWIFLRLRRGTGPASDRTPWHWDEGVLLLLLIGAFVYSYSVLTANKIDGDLYTFLAYASTPLTGAPINATEPLFNTTLGPGIRLVFHMFVPLWTMWNYWLHLDLVTFTGEASRAAFAVWMILSAYMLGKSAGKTRRFGMLVASVQMLIFLAAPFFRDDNVRIFFLTRTNADKFTVSFTMLTVVYACAIRYLRDGRRGAWLGGAGSAFALSTIHPLIAAMAALGVATFGGIHLLLHIRTRLAWIRVWLLAVVVAVVMVLPIIQLAMAIIGDPIAPTYPQSFDGWAMAEKQAPTLPTKQLTSVDLYGPEPNLSQIQASDAKTNTNPFLIWRFLVNQPRQRLIIFAVNRYISSPTLFLEPAYLLGLLLLPLLFWRFKSDLGAQLAVGCALGALFVMYNPVITPILGSLVVPWLLWRFVWMVPFALIIAYGIQRLASLVAWLVSRLPSLDSLGQSVRTYAPVCLVIGAAWFARPAITVNLQELLREAPSSPYFPVPTQLLARLNDETQKTGPVIVAADMTTSIPVPGYAGNAKVMAYRIFNTSETFPATMQDVALGRQIDQNYLYVTPVLTSHSVDLLRRYNVRFMITYSGSSLDTQLRLAPQWFQWLTDDHSYSLYAVRATPNVTATITANDAFVQHRWADARQEYQAALQQNPNDLLAREGLAETYHSEGNLGLAIDATHEAIAQLDVPNLHYNLGTLYASSGQVPQAIAEFNRSLQGAPQTSRYHVALADACLQVGQTDCARDQLVASADAQIYPDEGSRLIDIGQLWQTRNKNDVAITYFAQAEKTTMDQGERLKLANDYRQIGQYDRAETLLLQLQQEDPGLSDYPFTLANVYISQGRVDEAIALFNKAIRIDDFEVKDTTGLRVGMAQALLNANRVNDAQVAVDAALKLRSHDALGTIVQGDVYEQEHRTAQAIDAFKRAVQYDPSKVAAYLSGGNQFQLEADPIDGAIFLQTGVQANPQVPSLFVALANLSRDQGDVQNAIDSYNVALNLLHTDSVAATMSELALQRALATTNSHLASLYEDLGLTPTAMAYYQATADADYSEAWTQVLLGNALRRRGELAAAEVVYRNVLAVSPNYADNMVQLADLLSAEGKTTEANQLYDRAKKQFESDAAQAASAPIVNSATPKEPSSTNLGLVGLFGQYGPSQYQYGSGDAQAVSSATYDASTQDLLSAYLSFLQVDNQGSTIQGLARLYEKLNQNDKAIALYQQQIVSGVQKNLAPLTLAQYYNGLGDVYLSQRKFDLAIDAYNHAIDLDRWWPAPRASLVTALVTKGDRAAAVKAGQDAVAIVPGSPDVQLALGKALDVSGQSDRAIQIFQATHEKHPGNPDSNIALGHALQARSQWTDAQQIFEQGIALTPGDARNYSALAELYQAQARYAEAETQYHRALGVDQTFTGSYLGLGRLLASQARFNEALGAYGQGAKIDPTDWHWAAEAAAVHESLGQIPLAVDELKEASTTYLGQILPDPLLQLTALYRNQGQFTQAESAAQEAIKRAPSSPTTWIALGDLQQAEGRVNDALDSYQKAAASSPEAAPGYVAYGRALLANGRFDDGLKTLRDATTHAPADITGWVALGDALLGRNQRDAAIATYRQGLQTNPNSNVGGVALGLGFFKIGRFDDAVKTLTTETRTNPGYSPGFVGLAQAEEALGDNASAEKAYQAATVVTPLDPSAYDHLGQLYLKQRRTDDALKITQRVADLAPGNAQGYVAYGNVLANLGRELDATAALQKAIRAQPGNAPAGIALSKIFLGYGQLDEATATLNPTIRTQPGNVDALLVQGQIRERKLQWTSADQSYRTAAILDRSRGAAEIALGDLKALTGLSTDAIAAYQRGIAAEPNNVDAYVKLGQAYLTYGPTSQALATFSTATEQFSWVASPYVGQADYWRGQGQLDRALSTYQQGVAAAPRDPAGYVGLAAGQLAAGDYAAAVQSFQRALDVAPTDSGARLGLARLLLAASNRDGALREARQAVADSGQNAEAYVTLADVLQSRHDWTGADTALATALKYNPVSVAAYTTRAQLALDQGNAASAESALNRAIIVGPGDSNAWLTLGNFQLSHLHPTEALASLMKAADLAPAQATGYTALSRAHATLAHWDDANRYAQKAIAANAGDGAAYAAQANVYDLLGEYTSAQDEYRLALQKNPGFAGAWIGLGGAQAKVADFAGAIQSYQRDIAMPTSGVDGYVQLGALYLRIGPADRALPTIQAALARDSSSAVVYVGIGNAQTQLGNPNQAIAAFNTAIQSDPYQPAGYVALAKAQFAAANFDGARANYQKAVGLTPDDLGALDGLARLEDAVGNQSAARSIEQKAISYHHDDAVAPQAYLALAGILTADKLYDDANRAYHEALHLSAATAGAAAYSGLGAVQVAQRQWSTARDLYSQAIAAGPSDPAAWLGWGGFLVSQKEWDPANAAFQKAIALEPSQAAGYLGLAHLATARGRSADAASELRRGIAVQPGSAEAHSTLGDVLTPTDAPSAAAEYLEALRLQPNFPPAYVGQGNLKLSLADFAGAKQSYERDIALPTSGVDGYVRLGLLYLRVGPATSALDSLQAALKRDPSSGTVYVTLGDAQNHLGHPIEALAAYAKATQVEPTLPNAWVALGGAKLQAADFTGAQTSYQQALAEASDDLPALTGLAIVATDLGNTSEATGYAQQATALHKDDAQAPQAEIALGNVLAGQKQYAAADAAYHAALQLNPVSAGVAAYSGLAQNQLNQKQYTAARSLLQQALKAGPNDPAAWLSWGGFLFTQKEWTTADSAYQKAIALAPGQANGYSGLGRLKEMLGQVSDADPLLRKAVAVQPGLAEAHVTLASTLIVSHTSEADAEYREAMRVNRGYVPAYLAYGDYLLTTQDLPEAIKAYRAVHDVAPTQVTGYLRMAEAYRETGQNPNAKTALEQAGALPAAQTASTQIAIGDEYQSMGDSADAIVFYKEAIHLDPTQIQAQVGFVKSLEGQNQLSYALGQAKEAVRLFPNQGQAYVLLGSVNELIGNTDIAIAQYNQAIAVEPSYAEGYYALARIIRRERPPILEAAAIFERGLVQDQERGSYDGLLGLYPQHDVWEAVNRYTDLEHANPGVLWPKMALAQAYEVWGQSDNALAAFQRAQAVDPSDQTLYCHRGVYDWQLEQFDEARTLLGICLSLASPPPAASSARAAAAQLLANDVGVHISSPTPNLAVSGAVTVKGTAADPRFQYYKLEYHPSGDQGGWHAIGQPVNQSVTNGVLGVWDTGTLSPGTYVLRLTVVDQSGQAHRPNDVTVRILAP
jgi:tetratricopeptide (TPR) repeat protein